jgi:CheY-like chemotaxis protein
VREALALLDEKEHKKETISLIISDMNLPDGTGLDIIREVRTSSAWRLTPIIVLSGETNDGSIGSAYALGANCFLPKNKKSSSMMNSLRNLYGCWLESARLPPVSSADRLHAALERSIELRTRSSEFYLGLADACREEPIEMEFWLNHALSEGNMANLVTFFRNKLDNTVIPLITIEKLETMQAKVKDSLRIMEDRLRRTPSPQPATAYRWALDLAGTLDEEALAETLGCLSPVSPVATSALKSRAATQLQDLAAHIAARTEEAELLLKAESLIEWSKQLVDPGAGHSVQ